MHGKEECPFMRCYPFFFPSSFSQSISSSTPSPSSINSKPRIPDNHLPPLYQQSCRPVRLRHLLSCLIASPIYPLALHIAYSLQCFPASLPYTFRPSPSPLIP